MPKTQPLPRQSSLSNRRKRSKEIIGVAVWRLWSYKGIGLMGLCSRWNTCLWFNKSKICFAVVQILVGGSFLCHGSDGHVEPLEAESCHWLLRSELEAAATKAWTSPTFLPIVFPWEEKKNTLKAIASFEMPWGSKGYSENSFLWEAVFCQKAFRRRLMPSWYRIASNKHSLGCSV